MFKNTKIGTRLIFSYSIIILITATISILGIVSFQKMAKEAEYTNKFVTYPTGQLVNFSIPYGNVRTAMRDIAATTDAEETDKQKKTMETNWASMESAFLEYEILLEQNKDLIDAAEYKAVKTISAALVTYKDVLFNRLIPAAVANNNAEAIRIRSELVPPGNIIRDNINFLVELNIKQGSDELVTTKSIQASTITSSIMLLIVAIIAVVILAYFIIRSITRPIKQMIIASDSIAKGELNISLDNRYKDETGILSHNFQKVAASINTLISEIEDMSESMEKGDTDKRIDTSRFEGSYKHVAQGVNDMMMSMLTETRKFIGCMTKFSGGDFSADIEKLPGKKAVMNDSLNNMRSHLKAISSEINGLVSYATKGQLSSRADSGKYSGDWAEILEGLNSLMEAVSAPIEEAKDVLSEVALGNFDLKMSGKYEGDFLIIKVSINNTVENIASYIDEISEVLGALAQNDLDQDITREYVGEFANIKGALNNIIDNLNTVISDIHTAADQVASGAKMISESSMTLATGATEQASSIEELSATFLTINESTVQNAQSTKEAESLSHSSKNNAVKGDQDMNHMLASMEGIKESSHSISEIIKVIEDIAFQTNLLALNAAVEAARAGEHGKGFAVVAEEVRNLAGRSQNSAKETAGLIEESINRVNEGTEIAGQTANAFQTILGDVTKVAGIITGIAQASSEQAYAIGQVTEGITQITEVVQNNSATSEEAASASQQLSGQAEVLKSLVNVFNLKKGYM